MSAHYITASPAPSGAVVTTINNGDNPLEFITLRIIEPDGSFSDLTLDADDIATVAFVLGQTQQEISEDD